MLEKLKEKIKKYKVAVVMAVVMLFTLGTCQHKDNDNDGDDSNIDTETIYTLPNVDADFINSLNILDYNGSSLEDALKTFGYPYSMEYRYAIASYFGIDDYIGTTEQDEELIQLIKENYIDNNIEISPTTPVKPDTPIKDNKNEETKPLVKTEKPEKRPSENTETKKPVETKPVTQKDETDNSVDKQHIHNLGEWVSINDELEERSCSCGQKETREHKYINKVEFVQKKDGTHLIVTVDTCINCQHTKKNEKTKSCEFSAWVYDRLNDVDKRECKDCHYVETRNHNRDDGDDEPAHNHNLKLVDWNDEGENYSCSCGEKLQKEHNLDAGIVNSDGSTTYNCLNKDCGYTKTIQKEDTHKHEFKLVDWNDQGENYSCSCGEKLQKEHILDAGVVNSDGSTTYNCLNENCGYTKTIQKEDSHKHEFKLVDWNARGENYSCSCGETKVESHNLGEKETLEDGTIIRPCMNKGCEYQKKHIHLTDTEIDPVKSDSTCYEIVTICKECGELYRTEMDHTLAIKYEGSDTILYRCTVCGIEKEVIKTEQEEITETVNTESMAETNAYTLTRKLD